MYPNDNQSPPPPPPPDYLSQIAPKAPKTKIDFLKQKPIIIGAAGLILFVIIMMFAAVASNLSGGTTPLKTLSVRLTNTQGVAVSATHTIKNTKLRALNSALNIQLTNAIRDLTPILAQNNIETKKIDKKIISAESNANMLATLEDARLNAIYDRVYAKEMNTQLEKTILLMRQINKSSRNSKTKIFLDNAINNLAPIQKQFADFNAPNS